MKIEIIKRIITAFVVTVSSVNSIGKDEITDNTIYKYLDPSCESVSQFICDNLETFATEYNNGLDDNDKFKATFCERKIPVYIVTNDEYGICLDFNDSNGYMIVLDDYNVIDFKTTGDLEFLCDDIALYSVYDGFIYLDDNGEYAVYNKQYTDKDFICSKVAGTDDNGAIYDCNKYIKDEYGSGYKYTEKMLCQNFKTSGMKNQFSCSYYEHKEKNGKSNHSEGNCALVAAYNSCISLKKSGKCSRFNSNISKINIKKDKLYSKYANKTVKGNTYFVSTAVNKDKVPTLYQKIRNRAVSKYGYEVDNFYHGDLEEMIPWIGNQYNYKITAENDYLFTFEDNVVNEIKKGYPTIFNIAYQSSSPYSSHSVCVVGYRTYTKTTSFLGIKFTDNVNIAVIHDGWSDDLRYLDYESAILVGCFTRIRVK